MPQKSKPINENLNSIQISYLAGLFDGEGSVGIYELNNKTTKQGIKRSAWQFKVEIANTDWRIMQWLLDNVGGIVTKKSQGKAHWSQGYCWHLQGNNSEIFCNLIKPYTIIKTNQIDACLYFRNYWGTSNKKQTDQEIEFKREMVKTIKKMKRLDHAI